MIQDKAKKRPSRIRQTLLAATLLAAASAPALANGLLERPELRAFIGEMVERHQLSQAELETLFGQAELRPDIIRAISRPAERRPWHQYRPIFLTPERIRGGVQFWKDNAATLERAEQVYGVPAEIIVAIIGVETRYGRHKGSYRVLDALTTLAFDYPPRGSFFRSELEHYLLMTREEGLDPLAQMGSYAGAMGKPQFISSSFRHYAVDFDGDGKRDLWNNPADAIGSVANYLRAHRWERGGVIASRATVAGKEFRDVVDQGIRPHMNAAQLTGAGVRIAGSAPQETLGALIELENSNGNEYWVGWHNFYVITRYNHSALYAMAVYQLSEEIRAARHGQTTAMNRN